MDGVVLSEPKSPLPLLAAFESGLACKLRCQSPTSANFPQGLDKGMADPHHSLNTQSLNPLSNSLQPFMLRAAMLTCLYWAKLGTALMQHYSGFRNLLISPSLQPQVSFNHVTTPPHDLISSSPSILLLTGSGGAVSLGIDIHFSHPCYQPNREGEI